MVEGENVKTNGISRLDSYFVNCSSIISNAFLIPDKSKEYAGNLSCTNRTVCLSYPKTGITLAKLPDIVPDISTKDFQPSYTPAAYILILHFGILGISSAFRNERAGKGVSKYESKGA